MPLVAPGAHPEEQFGGLSRERDEAQLVDDQQVQLVVIGLDPAETVVFARLNQLVDQAGRGQEPHPLALPAGTQRQPDGQVGLVRPVGPDEDHVLVAGKVLTRPSRE